MEPVTRMGALMAAAANGKSVDLVPITREELLMVEGGNIIPATREEFFLQKLAEGGGGSSGIYFGTYTIVEE